MIRTALYFFISLSLIACGQRRQAAEYKGRAITVTEDILNSGGTDTIRFGHMRSGETAQLKLWLENSTERAIVITGYERSCGCTAIDYDRSPIMPGRGQTMTVTFDSRGEWGWQLKTVDILLSGTKKRLRLFIEADVE